MAPSLMALTRPRRRLLLWRLLPTRAPSRAHLSRVSHSALGALLACVVLDAFEELLGCPTPVNRGQQVFVLRAGLRALETWARGGDAPPAADPFEVVGEHYATDDLGTTLGGVRTPAVDAPVERLSGFAPEGASLICQLFGSTTPLPAGSLRARSTWRRTPRRRRR